MEVVQVALADDALGMCDRSFESGQRVGRVRIELRLLVILGLERGRVSPAQAQVPRQVGPHFPIILEVQFVVPQTRQKDSLRLCERGAGHRTHFEPGEIDPRVRRKRKSTCAAEVILSGRQGRRIVAVQRPHHFIADLHAVLPPKLGEVVLKHAVFADIAVNRHAADAAPDIDIVFPSHRDPIRFQEWAAMFFGYIPINIVIYRISWIMLVSTHSYFIHSNGIR